MAGGLGGLWFLLRRELACACVRMAWALLPEARSHGLPGDAAATPRLAARASGSVLLCLVALEYRQRAQALDAVIQDG